MALVPYQPHGVNAQQRFIAMMGRPSSRNTLDPMENIQFNDPSSKNNLLGAIGNDVLSVLNVVDLPQLQILGGKGWIDNGPRDGFLDYAFDKVKTETIFGSTANLITRTAMDVFSDGYSVDPNFNPYDIARQDKNFFLSHPFLKEDFENGRVLDFPNERAFWNYAIAKQDDWETRKRAENESFPLRMLSSIVAQIPDIALGTKLLETVGWAAKLNKVGKAVGELPAVVNYTTKIAIGAAVGAGENTVQELALYALYPDRNVKLGQSLKDAALYGAIFGAAVPSIAGGIKLGGETAKFAIPTPRLQRMSKQIQKMMSGPEITASRSAVDNEVELLKEMLKNETPVSHINMSPIKSPKTESIIKAIQDKWERAGFKINVGEHPGQSDIDLLLALDQMDKATQGNQLVNDGIAGKLIDTVNNIFPSAKGQKAVSSLARKAYRTFFSDPTLTMENVTHVLDHPSMQPAEAIKYNFEHYANVTKTQMQSAYKQHWKDGKSAFDALLSDGSTIPIKRHSSDSAFGTVVKDYLHQVDQIERGIRSELTFDFPDSVVQAAESHSKYTQQMFLEGERAGQWRGHKALATEEANLKSIQNDLKAAKAKADYLKRQSDESSKEIKGSKPAQEHYQDLLEKEAEQTKEVGQLKEFINRSKTFTTRRWLAGRILADKTSFIRKLTQSHRTKFQEIPINERELIPGILSGLDAADQKLIKELKLTSEVELSILDDPGYAPGLIDRYKRATDDYFQDSATRTFNKITNADNMHGIESIMEDGGNTSPLMQRVLDINEEDFSDYLDNNIYSTLEHYKHQVSGRFAAQQAIKKNGSFWETVVKDKLGVSLSESKYNPKLVMNAVKKDNSDLLDAAGKIDKAGGKGIQKAVKKSMDQYEQKIPPMLDELLGSPPYNSKGDPRWRAAGRIGLRSVMISRMGGVTLSSLTDIAATTALAGVSGRRQWIVFRGMLDLLPGSNVSRRGLEALEVAMDDGLKRTLISGNIEDAIGDVAFDALDTTSTKFLRAADRFTDRASKVFGTVTGVNNWNTKNRIIVAQLLLDDLVQGAQQISKAKSLQRGGMEVGEAIRKSGMSQQRAQWLNRMGLNADRSERFIRHLEEYGADRNGQQPWKKGGLAKHKGLAFPNWDRLRNSDRDLFDTLTGSINSETRNVIVEPTLATKPWMNGSFLGKVFNQFNMFGMAFSNQWMPVLSQRGSGAAAIYFTQAFIWGSAVSAIHNHLAGRRTFAQTAREWDNNPLGMAYDSVERAGLTGWLGRPLAWADALNVGPRRFTGNDVSSSFIRREDNPLAVFGGPMVGYLTDLYSGIRPPFERRPYTMRDIDTARRTIWFQNALPINAFYRLTSDLGIPNPLGEGTGIDPFLTRPIKEFQQGK